MRGTIVQRIPTAKNGASANSSVTCAVSCIMQLVCAHTWLYNIRWSSPKRSASGQHRKLRCDAVLRELNLKSVNNGRRYHEGPPRRGGQAPTRLRQARMIKKIATTRGVTRCHKYSAKCSALPQQISQETSCDSVYDAPGVCCRSAGQHMLRHSGRTCAPSCHWRYSQRSPRHTDESYEREFGSVRMKYLEHLLKTFGNQPAVWTAGSASGILCAYLPTAFWK